MSSSYTWDERGKIARLLELPTTTRRSQPVQVPELTSVSLWPGAVGYCTFERVDEKISEGHALQGRLGLRSAVQIVGDLVVDARHVQSLTDSLHSFRKLRVLT